MIYPGSQVREKPIEAAGLAPRGVRLMKEADLEQVLFSEASSYTMPWSRGMFLSELTSKPYSHLMVALGPSDNQIVGHVCYWVLCEELMVMNLTVHPEFRRRGIGGRLMSCILADGVERGGHWASLEVRTTNQSAIGVYESFGFKSVGIRLRGDEKPEEDGLVMACFLRGN